MGWSGPMPNAEGRLVGYAVEAICDLAGCEAKIDCGLAYVCGGMHDGGEYGCGRYFCAEHLYIGSPEQLCAECLGDCSALCAYCGEDGQDVKERCCDVCRAEVAA